MGMEPGTPFGASLERLATDWRSTHAMRDARLSALVAQVDGVHRSEGALANRVRRVNTCVDERVAEIRTRLRSRRLLWRDDTGARVNGRPQWAGVFHHAAVCVHVLRPSRGHGVSHASRGDPRPTLWVSALYRAPRHHPAEDWQVCLAQPLRKGPFALEAGDTLVAPRMQAILWRALALHRRRDTLAASTLSQDRGDLQRRVDRCIASQPPNSHGKRRQKRSAKIRDSWFLLLDDAAIPPTNHSSEQAMRMSTVFRRVTTGFRSAWGRDLCAAVRSVVNPSKRHGLSAYQAIQKALSPIGSVFEPG
jgi:transposase